jgi:PAS domain S-box-containing protein
MRRKTQLDDELAGLRTRVAELETQLGSGDNAVPDALLPDWCHMGDDVARLDLSGRIVASNGGIATDDSPGDSVFDHLPPAQADAVRQLMTATTATRRPDHVELMDEQAEPTSWWNLQVSPICQENRISGYFLVRRDVSSSHRELDKVVQSEQQLRTIVESAFSNVVVVDLEGRFQYANRVVDGLTIEQLIGMAAYDYMPPEDHPILRNAIETAHRTSGSFDYEARGVDRDGNLAWYASRIFPLGLNDDAPLFAICTAEVTERLNADQALRESEARYRAVASTAFDYIMIMALDGRIQYINRTAEGLSAETVIGTKALDHTSVEHQQRYTSALNHVIKTGESAEFVSRSFGPAETSAWYSCRMGPILQDGKVSAVTLRATDITARKAAEDAIRESESRFRKYFELNLIGMSMTTVEKEWIQFNDQLCEIVGYTRGELQSQTWADLTHPDDLAGDLAQHQSVLAGEVDGYTRDKRYLHKDGQIIHVSVSVKCVRRDNGTIDHFVALIQDVTKRRNAEEQVLRQRELLSHVSQVSTMVELASGLAHELNQPLAALELYASASKHAMIALRDSRTNGLAELVDKLSNQAVRAGDIVRRMRGLASRPPSERRDPRLSRDDRARRQYPTGETGVDSRPKRAGGDD